MPRPHFKITITKRSKDNSAIAGAAYQSGVCRRLPASRKQSPTNSSNVGLNFRKLQ